MTSQEPENPHSAEPEIPDTEVIAVAACAPVFVDSTGRRSRLLRRLAYAFGVLVMLYGGLISVSLAGGPVRSSAVLPLPGLENDQDQDNPPARPNPIAAPSASQSPKSFVVTDALPSRRTSAVTLATASRLESTRVPSKSATIKPAPSKTPTPSASPTHPVESTTTPATTPTTTAPTTTPATTPVVPPVVPPSPPSGGTGTGGQGGGSTVGGSTGTGSSSGTGSSGASGSPGGSVRPSGSTLPTSNPATGAAA